MIRDFFTTKLFFPLVSALTKRKFWNYYSESLQSQWLSKIELEKIQKQKLKKLLKHAYTNVPFYKELFDNSGFHPDSLEKIEDLKHLPIITKKDLQKVGIKKTSAKNLKEFNYYKDSTSGSTGEPFSFLGEFKHRDISTALTLRGYNWTGYNPGEKLILLWGYHKENIPTKIYKLLLNQETISAFDIDIKFEEAVNIIRKKNPKLLAAYTSAIVKFAKLCEENKIRDLHIPSIVTSAETLYPKHRELIENIFNSKVFDRYGSRELGEIAHECEKHNGLHVSDENLIVELEPFEDYPEWKKIIVTHLDKYAMPLIRYDTGDLGMPSKSQCSCGRSLSIIKEIKGRDTDFLKLNNGKLIPFLYFNYTFEQYGPYVQEFQIIQKSLKKIIVKLIPTKNLTNEIETRLKNRLSSDMDNIEVEIEKVSSIPLSKAGKKITVISEI